MRNLVILIMSIMTLSGFGQNVVKKKNEQVATPKQKQVMKIVNFDQLQTVLKKNDNKLYVLNFWATWCKPCVDELPGFMEVNKNFRSNPHFKMILVSMDIALEFDSGVKSFIAKNKIEPDVYLLDDNKRMNEWIPAVDKQWSGAIPATVFYRNGKKLEFKEGKMEKRELVQIINKYL